MGRFGIMCTWVNSHHLPDRVIRVLKGKHKDKRPILDRISVTDLIDEPLIRILYINHWDSIVRDYSDMLTMVQGTALHDRYEMCATDDEDTEHKFEDEVCGVTLVGKADSYFDKTILDIKQTGVYRPEYAIPKWTAQCNIYAWQRRKREQEVDKLIIDIWYRDWKQSKSHWKDYPKIPYQELELELWPFGKQEEYIHSQLKKHLEHPVYDDISKYTACSDKQRGIRYEAYRNKNKTPSKVGDTMAEMQQWVESEYNKGNTINIKRSKPIFCNKYCKARSVCPFNEKK